MRFPNTFAFLSLVFFFFSRKVWLFNQFLVTCGSYVLFTDPQILLFSNFFIKNESHGTIYTFKNYFVTVFFSFQFSIFSFQLYPNGPLMLLDQRVNKNYCTLLVRWSLYKYKYLWDMGEKDMGSNFHERASHTYTIFFIYT